MPLMKREKEELARLKRAGGKSVPVTLQRGTSNVTIRGKGFSPITKQIGGNTATVRAIDIIKARRKLIKLKLNR